MQQIHAILRSALSRAVKWQLVPRNVAASELIDAPRVTTPEIQPLSPGEAQLLLDAARGNPYEQLFTFMLSTGLRLGEALALRWHDDDGTVLIDLGARRATIKYTLERVSSGYGAPLDASTVYHAFKRLLRHDGLASTYRVHDLRHSTATYLLAAGVDPRIVMHVMGWSQVSMLKRYQHVLPAMLDDAVVRLETVLPTSGPSAS